MQPAYQRHTIEQSASLTENEQGLVPSHESYTARLEDNTHHRPAPREWDTASRTTSRSTATQIRGTTQIT
jgi:hypothetical protein